MNAQQQEAQQQIQDAVFANVYVPAFQKAAAARGLPINSQEDLEDLLTIASQCRMKQAAAVTGIYKKALADLTGKPAEKQAAAPAVSPYAIDPAQWADHVNGVRSDATFLKIAQAAYAASGGQLPQEAPAKA